MSCSFIEIQTHFPGIQPNSGFDGNSSPPFRIVPKGRSVLTGAFRVEEAWGLRVLDPGMLTAEWGEWVDSPADGQRNIRLLGLGEGITQVLIVDSHGREQAALVAFICDKLTKLVNFYYVTDIRGIRTQFNASNQSTILDHLNYIFEPQANITFGCAESLDVKVEWDFAVPCGKQKLELLQRDLEARTRRGNCNVFLVRSPLRIGDDVALSLPISHTSTPETLGKRIEEALAKTLGFTFPRKSDVCAIADNPFVTEEAQTVAHEIGHVLGLALEQHSSHSDALMYAHHMNHSKNLKLYCDDVHILQRSASRL